MIILWIILGIAVGAGSCYLVLRSRIQIAADRRQEVEDETRQLEEIKSQYSQFADRIARIKQSQEDIEHNIKILEAKREEIQKNLEFSQEQAKKSYDTYCNQQKELVLEKENRFYDEYTQSFTVKTEAFREAAEQEYLDMLKEQSEYFQAQTALYSSELTSIKAQLADLQAKAAATIEAQKRALELSEKQEFYKIQISKTDQYEIDHLQKVVPFLRNSRPVCKIIWESYYRNPTSDLVGRIIGAATRSGIYKITHPDTGLAYIGQAVDVGDRIKQHVKCGLGIDAPANKLYMAMQKYGIENFTFELLEECPRSQLNEREKYYIDLYKTQEWGWNQTKGGSASK